MAKDIKSNGPIKKIKNDDDYYSAWKRVNELEGRSEALVQVFNGEIENPLKVAKKADRERNKLIKLMKGYLDKPHKDSEFYSDEIL